MKKITMCSIGIICLAVLSFNIYKSNKPAPFISNNTLPSAKINVHIKNLDDLIEKSPIVVEGKTTSPQETFTYGGLEFVKTTLTVKKILKGTPNVHNEQITFLQTKIQEDSIIKKEMNPFQKKLNHTN